MTADRPRSRSGIDHRTTETSDGDGSTYVFP